jgi:hypothetical protein
VEEFITSEVREETVFLVQITEDLANGKARDLLKKKTVTGAKHPMR